jgi:hypothetical protein
MTSRNRWLVSSLTGLSLAAVAGLSFAVATEEAAGGNGSADASPVRRSEIQLRVNQEGNEEQLTLTDLHTLAVGESRSLATQSGTPVVVTRDAEGFEIDIDGREIRLDDEVDEDAGPGERRKRIIVRHGGDEEGGGSNVMFLRHGSEAEGDSAAGDDDADVVMVRKLGADGHAFAFATDGSGLPALPVPVEATIRRLEASAAFQELDAPTRAKVVAALRETAPKARTFVTAEPGAKRMVIEIEDEAGNGAGN